MSLRFVRASVVWASERPRRRPIAVGALGTNRGRTWVALAPSIRATARRSSVGRRYSLANGCYTLTGPNGAAAPNASQLRLQGHHAATVAPISGTSHPERPPTRPRTSRRPR